MSEELGFRAFRAEPFSLYSFTIPLKSIFGMYGDWVIYEKDGKIYFFNQKKGYHIHELHGDEREEAMQEIGKLVVSLIKTSAEQRENFKRLSEIG